MPLFKRKPYFLEAPPRDLKPDESVFQVRHTKEIFRDYEEYLSRMHLYRKRLWTCKVTGKQNLTYEEALVSERKATEQVQHFPKEFMGPVLSMVQFSPLRIDDLVDRIYKEFKHRFVLNEEVFGKSAESFSACKILKVLQHASKGEYHYEVGWIDEHCKRFGTSTEAATSLIRKKYPFTRALLKAFIREAAVSGTSRNSIWFVKNKLARKYKIPVEPPPKISTQEPPRLDGTAEHSIVEVEVIENGGHNTRKRRKREDDTTAQKGKTVKKGRSSEFNLKLKETKAGRKAKVLREDLPTYNMPAHKGKNVAKKGTAMVKKPALKKNMSMDDKSTGKEGTVKDNKPPRAVKKIVKEVVIPARPPPPPIKYPIEDTLVRPCLDDPVFTSRPLPSTDFLLPMECLGNLLMIWDFCSSFSKALQLSPFSLEEFEKSLDYREGNAPLIAEVLFALLRTNLSDPVLWEEFIKKRKRKSEVSLSTWKDDLSDLLQLTSLDKLGSYLPSIRQGCYKQFDITVKLEILQDLVDRSLNSSIIRSQIDENIGEHQALCAKRREEEVEGFKRRKQEKLKQLNETSDEGVEANGKIRDDNIDEARLSADDKDGGAVGIKRGIKDEIIGDEDGQAVGWKTKGKRKLAGNHSPNSANGSLKKEEQVDIGMLSKSKHRQKETLKQVDEEQKKLADGKSVIEKTNVQVDPSSEHKSQEQTALENQKRRDHLDRELEKRSIRTIPLGKDRDYNVYWFFSREGRVFVENKDSTKWGYYTAKEEFEDLLSSLNPKGVREKFLQKQIEKHYNKISNVLLRRSKEIAQKIAMEEVVVRRSVRVRTAPRIPGFLSYVNKLRPS